MYEYRTLYWFYVPIINAFNTPSPARIHAEGVPSPIIIIIIIIIIRWSSSRTGIPGH